MRQRVLILCTANSIRSQIAEGLWRELGGEQWNVYSAGVAGAGGVHPMVHRVLLEEGIDSSEQFSKPIEYFQGQRFDVVCCVSSEAVNAPLNEIQLADKLDWVSQDPTISLPGSERMDAFRRLAETLRKSIERYLSGGMIAR